MPADDCVEPVAHRSALRGLLCPSHGDAVGLEWSVAPEDVIHAIEDLGYADVPLVSLLLARLRGERAA